MMELKMHEPRFPGQVLTSRGCLKPTHIGMVWIDSQDEPCFVVVGSGSLPLVAVIIETGAQAVFPIRSAPVGTLITIKQELPVDPS